MSALVVRVILALYPPAWRRRYAAEVADLVAGSRAPGLRVTVDLAAGAGREWLWSAAMIGSRATSRDRALGALARLVWAWGVFVVGAVVVQKTCEHWDWGVQSPSTLSLLNRNARVTALAQNPAFFGVVVAGVMLPSLVAVMRSDRRAAARAPARVAISGSAAFIAAGVGIVVWATHLDAVARNGGSLLYGAAVLAWAILFVAVTAAWCAVLARLVRVAAPGRWALVCTAWAAVVSGAGLVLVSVTVAVWFLAPGDPPPSGFVGIALMVVGSVSALAGALPGALASHRIA